MSNRNLHTLNEESTIECLICQFLVVYTSSEEYSIAKMSHLRLIEGDCPEIVEEDENELVCEYATKYKRYNTLRRIKEVDGYIWVEAMFVAMMNKDKETMDLLLELGVEFANNYGEGVSTLGASTKEFECKTDEEWISVMDWVLGNYPNAPVPSSFYARALDLSSHKYLFSLLERKQHSNDEFLPPLWYSIPSETKDVRESMVTTLKKLLSSENEEIAQTVHEDLEFFIAPYQEKRTREQLMQALESM